MKAANKSPVDTRHAAAAGEKIGEMIGEFLGAVFVGGMALGAAGLLAGGVALLFPAFAPIACAAWIGVALSTAQDAVNKISRIGLDEPRAAQGDAAPAAAEPRGRNPPPDLAAELGGLFHQFSAAAHGQSPATGVSADNDWEMTIRVRRPGNAPKQPASP